MIGSEPLIAFLPTFLVASPNSGWILPTALVLLAGTGAYSVFRYLLEAQGAPDHLQNNNNASGIEAPDEMPHARTRSSTPITRERALVRDGGTLSNFVDLPQLDQLPIGNIREIIAPQHFDDLPDSIDAGLLAAIDQLLDETDSEAKLVSLKTVAGFRVRNAVDALSQVALYDHSSYLRAKAVASLADLDHPSVFPPIVLACADSSREVRAAAARALVKVTFDRGDEWIRAALSEEKHVSRQIARAAVEGGIAERSFDRLTMRDERAVYEGVALVVLLTMTGETEKLLEAIRGHKDTATRLALLHAVRVANVAAVVPDLTAFIAAEPLNSVIADKARETVLGICPAPLIV